MQALSNLKVLDLTRVLAGPFCTMTLGDLGADVIKVEAPGGSDETRQWGPPFLETESAYYLCANRNKRAITLDLKSNKGREILKRLVEQSDIIIENFKHGTMEKWGLGYESLKLMNPQIIYCSITGFGQTGPYKDLPGYDFIIQGMSGLMSITGSEDSGSMKVGVAISDLITGLYSTIGILSAVNERNQSGVGQYIDISLLDSQIGTLANVASNYLISGNAPRKLGNHHPNIVPYQAFSTRDGEIIIAVGNDQQFKKLCHIIEQNDLANDEKFISNSARVEHRSELVSILSTEFKNKNTKEWIELLNQQHIPCGPINTIKDVFKDPQVKERGMKVEVPHPQLGTIPLVGSPLKLSRTPVEIRRHPPLAGEHTVEVLLELGYNSTQIEDFKELHII